MLPLMSSMSAMATLIGISWMRPIGEHHQMKWFPMTNHKVQMAFSIKMNGLPMAIHRIFNEKPLEKLQINLLIIPARDPKQCVRGGLCAVKSNFDTYSLGPQACRAPISNTCTRSIARFVGKTSMKDFNTTSLNKISRDISGPPGRKSIRSKVLSTRSLHKTSMRDLFTRALYKVSSQDPHVWHLYTRSPARSRHEIPTKDLYERSLLQELLTRSLRKTSIRQGPYEMFQLSTRSLPKTCMRDLFTRLLYKIFSVSSQELSTRSLRKTSMRDLYTRALYKVSSQAPNETSLCKISWYPWTS